MKDSKKIASKPLKKNYVTVIQNNELTNFFNLLKGIPEYKNIEDRFDAIADYLMNYLCFDVGRLAYRIIEVEIYYYNKVIHPDPYVHCAKEQLSTGEWYFNGFGLDITFGDKNNDIYGGILIRGIKKLHKTEEYISGPSNVLKEIFSNLGGICGVGLGLCLREFVSDEVVNMKPIKTSRIGLVKKMEDSDNYHKKQYRYLVEINLQHKFKEKEKVISELITDGKKSKEDARDILGYKISL